MKKISIFGTAALVLAVSLSGFSQAKEELAGVVETGAQPELVQEGFTFTEGPVGTADGGLYFSDLRVNRTFRLDATGKIAMFRENTNGSNGLALMRNGDLLAAEGDAKRITRIDQNGNVTTLTDGGDSRPFLAPNDLIVDSKGGIYFTDPGPRPVAPGRKAYVYYLPAGSSRAITITDQVARPNGLTVARDGKTLIVDDTLGDTVFQFDVQPDGSVKDKRPFAVLHDVPAGQESGADGLALDRAGRVYVTTVTGIQVFDASGKYVGTIHVPRQAANVAFSGPGKRTLYITAREGLYRLKMAAQGPDRLGK